jgi:hypothetical protein
MGADIEQGKLPSPRTGGPVQAVAPRGDCLLNCSRMLNGLTAVCACLCIAAHLMAISVAAHYSKVTGSTLYKMHFRQHLVKMVLWT